ncbi:MAG TPA: 5-oxoprolinase subunit PxpB, partial [Pyrinomonadaceae bacterium]|nr:5-oxoprolinase subunit PxpB [Pyrinomonadaceae bacterium]
ENTPFDGIIEAVPAYASLTVFYDSRLTTFEAVKRELARLSNNISSMAKSTPSLVEIPVLVSSEMDLARVAAYAALSSDEVLEIFLAQTYRVYMLGFLPGFAYMGEVDDKIAAPRLETPRTKVPKGSIGIAGKQTGIYPLESPGGWNIIGHTDLTMFDPTSDDPCRLNPGDEVRFVRC